MLPIRVTDRERDAIRAAAKWENKKVSEFIRAATLTRFRDPTLGWGCPLLARLAGDPHVARRHSITASGGLRRFRRAAPPNTRAGIGWGRAVSLPPALPGEQAGTRLWVFPSLTGCCDDRPGLAVRAGHRHPWERSP